MVAGAQLALRKVRAIGMRPLKKIEGSSEQAGSDVFLYMVKLGDDSVSDSVTILNGNTFRLISAINEIGVDTLAYPTLIWRGGTAPFTIKLQRKNESTGAIEDNIVGTHFNLNNNVVDGTGDLVLEGALREYILLHANVDLGWAADDLVGALRQDKIGLSIIDSSVPERKLFLPFTPDETETALLNIYTHYGPPIEEKGLLWTPTLNQTYGVLLYDSNGYTGTLANTELDATIRNTNVSGTSSVAGVVTYYLDSSLTSQIYSSAYKPSATSGGSSPNYVTIYAKGVPSTYPTDSIIVLPKTFVIYKSVPVLTYTFDETTTYGALTFGDIKDFSADTEPRWYGSSTIAGTFTYTSADTNTNNTASFSDDATYIEPDNFNLDISFAVTDTDNYTTPTEDTLNMVVSKDTPTPKNGTTLVFNEGSVTYYQLMQNMQFSNSHKTAVNPWVIEPTSGSGYTYNVTNHASGITVSTEDSSGKLASQVPRDSSFNISAVWVPVANSTFDRLYNTNTVNFTIGIMPTSLVGTWTGTNSIVTQYWTTDKATFIAQETNSLSASFVFNADGTGTCSTYSGSSSFQYFKYVLSGSTLTLTFYDNTYTIIHVYYNYTPPSTYTAVNVTGVATGMAVSSISMSFVITQWFGPAEYYGPHVGTELMKTIDTITLSR